ncbi:ornithine cyclodeaminase family protein [Acidobacteria bacterium AH-259-D05]|nr:ornithine cyclodeaminase family protein [Acidobacteria bacterium AH-259-D05]
MLILSNEEIEPILTMELCVEALAELYRQLAKGEAVNSPRADILVPLDQSDKYYGFKSMAGVASKFGVAALRLNSDVLTWPTLAGVRRRVKLPMAPGNRFVGLVILFSSTTGEPLSIFPDGVIQRFRVGATNALGARHLAREDASSIGLLGSGWQAGTQLMGFCAVRNIHKIRVYSPNASHRRAFAEEMASILNLEVEPVDSAAEAVRDVDILATATNAVQPIAKKEWLQAGMHVSCIKKQEVDESVFNGCDLVVLHYLSQVKQNNYASKETIRVVPEVKDRGWWTRVHNGQLNGKTLYDLSDLAGGKLQGRADPRQITCFMNNIGLGLQFAAVGARILQLAKEQGLGKEIPTDWFLQTVHP